LGEKGLSAVGRKRAESKKKKKKKKNFECLNALLLLSLPSVGSCYAKPTFLWFNGLAPLES
jgi:hypothetical protein